MRSEFDNKIIVIGANGQLGSDICKAFYDKFEVIPLTHKNIEITDINNVKFTVEKYVPDWIINTAAYHNVPECERNPEKALSVNAIGAFNLAKVCKEKKIKLVHISTDYVFDGKKRSPYFENDIPNPLNVYAISKLTGEFIVRQLPNHYIIRVASLFGVAGCRAKGGGNFIETMLNLAKTRDTISVTSNIICSPTYTYDAAAEIKQIIAEDIPPGTYHVVNSGSCSWYEFALEIFNQMDISLDVLPKEESEEVEGVVRPLYSALSSNILKPIRSWQDALSAYLMERSAS